MKHLIKFKSLLSIILLAFVITSCNNSSAKKDNGKIKVLSSFSILTDMIQEIGGENVEVYNLVPIGMAPHEYDPKPDDVKFANNADLVIYNGLNLEGGKTGWLNKLTQSVNFPEEHIYAAAEGVTPLYLKDEKGAQEINPHAFLSPKVGIIMAENIKKALIATDPENKAFYEKQADAYIAKLTSLEQEYRSKIGELPEAKKVFIASELAFQYLTNEYGLKEGCIWPIDTDKNGTPDQIKAAISFINTYHPAVLFIESNVDRRPMETVSTATNTPIYKDPILSDELGRSGQQGDTYLKYLQYNLDVLYNGLSGEN